MGDNRAGSLGIGLRCGDVAVSIGTATRKQLARAGVEGVVCGLLDGLDALTPNAPADRRLILIGGVARSRAYRQILADLSGRPVNVPDATEPAIGACAHAAAVATGTEPADIGDRWPLGVGALVGPGPSSEAADVRGAYATLRDTP